METWQEIVQFFQENAIFPISPWYEMLVACLTLEEKYSNSKE